MRKTLVLGLLLSAACGEVEDEEPAMCAPAMGLYKVTYDLMSGDCPPMPDSVTNVGGDTSADGTCTGPRVHSANGCSVESDLSCSLTGGSSARIADKTTWSADGLRGKGTLSVRLTGAREAYFCAGLYETRYQKL